MGRGSVSTLCKRTGLCDFIRNSWVHRIRVWQPGTESKSLPSHYHPLPVTRFWNIYVVCLKSLTNGCASSPWLLQLFKMEDVSMGMWVQKFNKTRQLVEYSHDVKFFQAGCFDGYYTTHYQSPQHIICLWRKPQSGSAQCCNARWQWDCLLIEKQYPALWRIKQQGWVRVWSWFGGPLDS